MATAMAQLTDYLLTQMDLKKIVGTVLLDFSAAFNVIEHEILLSKLKKYGFSR